ncbi:uracil phosphoribosyltransferase [Rubricoccus marinus]|uniref:Uracil phosphoribosyltransferase n=1 Tax=Rubricoccus marinus TaxID=716817 RepID=A0A259TYS3_9BACT|nr:uracil phosphoribosyltransferase [Rubricoccus marinus]OZC02902.1 uracil phosphoribosyltransferase [Rubricoccus marinus]
MLTVVDHPLLARAVTTLRDKTTPHGEFRAVLNDAAAILAYEALRTIPTEKQTVQTPLEETDGVKLAQEVVVVPVLRAGLGLVDGFVRFVPEARVGHLGMYRDETTHRPVDYYSNIPPVRGARVFVVDPMLATGGSAAGALSHLKQRGADHLTFVCLVAAPEGVERLHEFHPDVDIVTAALDRELDDKAYIRPGLGDAGDRIFGTHP